MARIPRYHIISDGTTHHITWQCHNKSWLMHDDSMKSIYYGLLLKYKKKYKVKVHSYSFMSSHPHMTITCETKELVSDFFRIVNSMFAKTYNRLNDRRGQVVMDRYKSPRIGTDEDHLKIIIYGDFNQVRAKMVKHPEEWQWSSYHHYAHGRKDPLVDDAPCYTSLGKTPEERQVEYRKLVNDLLWGEVTSKQNYSAVHFIGDPEWVQRKYNELQKEIQARREVKKEICADKTKTNNPPGNDLSPPSV